MSYDFRQSFGPGQVTPIANIPDTYYVLEELSNFSISSHFDKIAIRRLGHRLPVGWATGSGTIAGTLVFAETDRAPLWRLRNHQSVMRIQNGQRIGNHISQQGEVASQQALTSGLRPEQLPPFNLTFVHVNEVGTSAISRLYDIVIADTGVTKGQQEKMHEHHMQYKARFHEQIRLQRAMTTDEMVKLAQETEWRDPESVEGLPENYDAEGNLERGPTRYKKRVPKNGFFNDPRRPSLVSDLTEAIGGPEELADALDERNEKLFRGGLETGGRAIEIADTGEVVYRGSEDTTAEVGDEVKRGSKQAIDQASTERVHKIEENLIYEENGSLTNKTVQSHLALIGDDLYMSGGMTDPGPDDFRDNPGTRVASFPGTSGSIGTGDYLEGLLTGHALSPGNVKFMPPNLSLEIGEGEVVRNGRFGEVDDEVWTKPPVGSYSSKGPVWEFLSLVYKEDGPVKVARLAEEEGVKVSRGDMRGEYKNIVFEYVPESGNFEVTNFADPVRDFVLYQKTGINADTFTTDPETNKFKKGVRFRLGFGYTARLVDGGSTFEFERNYPDGTTETKTINSVRRNDQLQFGFDRALVEVGISANSIHSISMWAESKGTDVFEYQDDGSQKTEIKGTFRGRDLDLTYSSGGGVSGLFGPFSYTNETSPITLVSGVGHIQLNADDTGASLEFQEQRISV